ncbi:MAG: ABC transporter permease [Chitinophagia bacterium]|nr:ABC transporter permease [Chitinophagia bacterium]
MQNITRIYALSKRNIILRYKNSFAGFLWGFLKPLLYLLIFIIVFSSQVSANNYVLYATSGLVFWFFFSNLTHQSVNSIINSNGIIKSINVPTIFFPLSEAISELFNLVLTLVVFLIAMHWFGLVYSPLLVFVIPAAILFAIFSFGLSLILCSLNVFFRDVGILWTTVQPAIFYLTPIAYNKEMITKNYPWVVYYNPIYYFIELARTILYQNQMPNLSLWGICFGIAGGMFLLGYVIFNGLKNQFISTI